ncbi:MAG: MotA/TolQ/ExbB proton channel family protein [Gammaproteobacteria bacterium]|nr:MotA/TolQ/ExbB proton channel family protein [Gammaproteobacteria bacterium]NNK32807.1 flagellar motor protein MotA [Xanthomonadales bacterium]
MKRCDRSLYALTLVLFLALAAPGQAQDDTGPEAVPPEAPPVIEVDPQKALDDLEAAYQKEYAFLDAQIRDLQSRLSDFEGQSARNEREKQAQIDRLEGEYITLQSRGERVNELLTEAERQIESVEDSRSVLEATFLQAGSTLEPFGMDELRSEAYLSSPDGERIDRLFDRSLALLDGLGSVRREPGAFFLADGTEVAGDLVRIGNIATFGVSDRGAGPLAPAGDGRFKIWADAQGETAMALNAGQAPAQLGIFLYESSAKAIEERAGKTVLSVINSGGTIAWIIVGLGAIAGLLVILRIVFLRSASASTGRVAEQVGHLVSQGKLDEALEACKTLKGATARVVGAAVRNLERDREHIEDIVAEQILHESSHLNRFGAFIIVIAAVSPLLGLLGTVTGMISTFDIITEFGTGDPKLLSSGISIALVTTEVGLAVAIPALIFGNLLSGWAESIKDDMEKAALRVMNLYKGKPLIQQAA